MKSLSDLWDSILARLSGELSDTTIKTWFDEISVVTMEDSALVLHCSNAFKKNTVEARFLPQIKAALKDIFSTDMEVKILNDEQLAAYHGVAPDQPGDLFDSDAFTFETYVVGPQNKLAYAAAKSVAEKPAESYNPLFIYGDSGLGKTHLLYAIAHLVKKRRPEARIVYIKGDDFTNELVSSIRENRNAEFREKYREATVLLVDDIQFIAGKIQTQEEFFHTFNALYEARKQIVISSDKPPKDIPTLEERLRSRFEWGLIADISKPDLETRIAILQKKAELEHLDVPDEVNTYIATKAESNIRELEGCLTRVLAYANISHKPLSEEVAAEALRDMIPVKDPRRITPDLIMAIVAEYFSVSVDDLKSKRRNREITVPRQVAMYLIRELNGASLPRIGLEFGGRDHTTVIHACDKVAEDIQRDASMRSTVEALKKRIQGA